MRAHVTRPRRMRQARGARAERSVAASASCRGVWRLRLPLPVARRAALQRLGARRRRRDRARRHGHARAGLDAPPRAGARAGRAARSSDVRLLVCTHAHVDHCGQAAPIVERAGLRAVDAPDHEHLTAPAGDPEAALARRIEIAPPERRAGGAAAAWVEQRRGAGHRPAPGRSSSTATSSAGVAVETDLGAWEVHRDARPRALARLPAPARAAAADLGRPPARPRLALLRLRLDARPGGRSSWPRSTWSSGSTRASRCPATGARSPTCAAHVDGQPRAGRASASTPCAPRSPSGRPPPPTSSLPDVYGERFEPERPRWLLTKTALLPDAPRGRRARVAPCRGRARSAGAAA